MKKDIEIPIAKNIEIVAVREWDKEFLSQSWYVYLVNNRKDTLETVLVLSRGNNEDRKTSILRHNLGSLKSKASVKVEMITEEVFGFTNEYMVTFFAEGKLFERNFVFEANTISEENSKTIAILDLEGVSAS
jgi:hypothetical protein